MASRPSDCDASLAHGLALQLLPRLNHYLGKMGKDKLVEVPLGAGGLDTSGATVAAATDRVVPFLQEGARDSLLEAAGALDPGLRPLVLGRAWTSSPQQYLKYAWKNEEACQVDEMISKPGKSSYGGGYGVELAEDSAKGRKWRGALQGNGWLWGGDTDRFDELHFRYAEGNNEIQKIELIVFQMLWNEKNSDEQIRVDGIYGSNTERVILKSPINGWP